MRKILVVGAALALTACGGGTETTNTADLNTMAMDNMMMDANSTMGMDSMGGMNGAAGMDANMAMDSNTANLMALDANTNDPDTNLSNGL